MHAEFWWGKLFYKVRFEGGEQDGRMTLRCIIRRKVVRKGCGWN
jgi:hypothetical protein